MDRRGYRACTVLEGIVTVERIVIPLATRTGFGISTESGMSTEFGKNVTQWAAGLARRKSDIKCVAYEGASK